MLEFYPRNPNHPRDIQGETNLAALVRMGVQMVVLAHARRETALDETSSSSTICRQAEAPDRAITYTHTHTALEQQARGSPLLLPWTKREREEESGRQTY